MAFLAVDAVLVGLALRGQSAAPEQALAETPAAALPTQTSTAAPVTTPTPRPSAAAAPARPAYLLDLVDARTAWRARPGACGGAAAALARTTDAGKTWQPVRIPATTLLRISFSTPAAGWVVGTTDHACTPAFLSTGSAGGSWSAGGSTARIWYLLPPGGSRLHAPGGDVDAGCPVTAVASVSTRVAAVLCAGGTARRTTDSGRSWTTLGADHVLAVDFSSPRAGLLVLPGDAGCHGVRVRRTTDGGATSTPAGCVVRSSGWVGSAGPTLPITLSVAGPTRAMIVDANGATWTSTDGGTAWSAQ